MTDPRITSMTPEMVELEFAHIALDRKLKSGNSEQYEDSDYEDYDQESEDHDNKISDEELPDYEEDAVVVKDQEEKDDWEDVAEIDD